MGIIAWLVLGLIGGFVGNKILNLRGDGLLMDMALGIVGAVVGGMIAHFFGQSGISGLNIWSILVAILGSVVVLYVYHNVLNARR